MAYNFDEVIERRSSGSTKWNQYDPDVLPMSVADMDFRVAEPIIQALQSRINHGIFGYEWPSEQLAQLVCDHLKRLYQWLVFPEDIIFLPNLRAGMNLVCSALAEPGSAAITFTPIYPPFLSAPTNHGMLSLTVPLKAIIHGATLRYEIDSELFDASITRTTRLLNLSHPHNPTGRSFTTEELRQVGEICIKHNLVICSDEIHCDLLMGNTKHIPFACVSSAIADRCITLMSPSKTFNISGLGAAYAVIQNSGLRKRFQKAVHSVNSEMNVPGTIAFQAAYEYCDQWLHALLKYLLKNRDMYVDYVLNNYPGAKTTVPEATYLAWLDCRQMGIQGNVHKFFLNEARVALADGKSFGEGNEGFVRLSFACPSSQMLVALERMKSALVHKGIVSK